MMPSLYIIPLLAMTPFAFAGGATGDLEPLSITSVTIAGDQFKPCVFARPAGGLYLAWASRHADQTAVLFASSRDGVRFTDPIRVSAAGMDLDLGAESGPNAAIGSDGTIYVVWASGKWSESYWRQRAQSANSVQATADDSAHKHSGHGSHGAGKKAPMRPENLNVYLARSTDGGQSFSDPIKVNDDADGSEHRFPAVTTGDNGAVYVAWLDKRPSKDGANACNVYVSVSRDAGRSFSANVNATAAQENAICHCCRVAIVSRKTDVVVAFRNDREDLRDNFLVRSSPALDPFSEPIPLEASAWHIPMCPMNGPSLVPDEAGNLHAVWMTGAELDGEPIIAGEYSAGYKVLYRSQAWGAGAGEWGPIRYLANGEHPRIALARGGLPAVTWDRRGVVFLMVLAPSVTKELSLSGSGAFPTITTDRATGALYIAWQEQTETDGTQIKLAKVKLPLLPAAKRRVCK
jgi:hypothetical protein